jgi:hypothetical protein
MIAQLLYAAPGDWVCITSVEVQPDDHAPSDLPVSPRMPWWLRVQVPGLGPVRPT